MTVRDGGASQGARGVAPRARRKAGVTALTALLAVLVSGPSGSFLAAPIASAHTELESSTPADGDIVTDIVDEIEVVFTEQVELVGEGIEVLLPNEQISDVEPTTEDGITFVLEFDPPIGNGEVGVRFDVISADGHPVTGSFSFTIDAPTPEPTVPQTTDAVAASTTTAAATTVPPTTSPSTTAGATPETDEAETDEAETDEASEITVIAVASAPSTAPVGDTDDDEVGDSTTSVIVIVAIVAAVAAAIGGVIYARKRGATPPVDPSAQP
jgi:methionine-rich copper-binding protein CopC